MFSHSVCQSFTLRLSVRLSVCLRKAAQISCFANIATCEMCEKYTYIRNVTHLFLVFFPFSAVTPNRSVFLLIRGFVLLCTSPRREKGTNVVVVVSMQKCNAKNT